MNLMIFTIFEQKQTIYSDQPEVDNIKNKPASPYAHQNTTTLDKTSFKLSIQVLYNSGIVCKNLK